MSQKTDSSSKPNESPDRRKQAEMKQKLNHRHNVRVWIRRVLLSCCGIAFICVLFWDSLFEHGHGHDPNGDPADCPYVQMTGTPDSPVEGKGRPVKHDEMVSFQGLPALSELLPLEPKLEMKFESLSSYDGSDELTGILLAIEGVVVDVTAGRSTYGPGKGYAVFAGRTVTRAIALTSLEVSDMTDDCSDLTSEQFERLENWKRYLFNKYPIVAHLAIPGQEWRSRLDEMKSVLTRWKSGLVELSKEQKESSITMTLSSLKKWVNMYGEHFVKPRVAQIKEVTQAQLESTPKSYVIFGEYSFEIQSGTGNWMFDSANGIWPTFQGRNVTTDILRGPTGLQLSTTDKRNTVTFLKDGVPDVNELFKLYADFMMGYWVGQYPVLGKVVKEPPVKQEL